MVQRRSAGFGGWLGMAALCWLIPACAAMGVNPLSGGPYGRSLVEFLPDLQSPTLFREVVSRNLLMVAVNLGGIVCFGTTTLLNLIVNGLTFGTTVRAALDVGVSWREIGHLTLPHGIELIGLWLSGAVGFRGLHHGYSFLRHSRLPDLADVRTLLLASASSAVIIIVAAWLEVIVTLRPLLP